MHYKNVELVNVEDIYETKWIALMKSKFTASNKNITKFALGIKDKQGDIIKIITLFSYYKNT
ncbi:MAG: hypothetical protein NC397_02140 [Clostridium sp.]|nr:hypothetical protein [Clostridium sp.]